MDEKNRNLSKEDILKITKSSINKTFGDLGLTNIDKANKGGLGGFVEENIFKYKANSDNNPDFIKAGIELKVTPIKKNNDGTFSSKERLVLNMINYAEEVDKTFETSSFYKKNRLLLIWFYLYSKGLNPSSFKIVNYDLFEFEKSAEFRIIKRDWETIHKKIVEGKAHEISESDTMFLAACTKGATSKNLTCQPNNPKIKAKPRAFSFKNSFMTRIYRELIHAIAPYSSFISDDEWMENPLETIYKEKLSVYHEMSMTELKLKFGIKSNAKQLPFMIAQKMLGISGRDSGTQEMEDAGIKLKIVRLHKNGSPYESMSFPAFDFTELIGTPWEESSIREDFVDWKLMFFIFKDDEKGVSRFDNVRFWNIPNSIVDGEIKQMFEKCAELVKNGNALYYDDNGRIKDNFPKEKRNSNGVCHVRPHGRVAVDTFDLPVKDKITNKTSYTKQSFWFNKKFIKQIIGKLN